VEAAGADLVVLQLTTTDSAGQPVTGAKARAALRAVLGASGLPIIVFGTGQAELDNDLLVAVAEEGVGERLVLGPCEEKNYRTIVAAAMANGHLVTTRTPMDVNLAKQLTILVHDMGMPMERMIMDPPTGALGYGIEYGYSVMERLRLAALQGDAMTQQPMIVTPGEEAWRTKEARASEGVPAAWGDWAERAVNWEAMTAAALVESGADIVVMRHPASAARIKEMIAALMAA
jgi:acetyl-CoA decarbonylase/synthase complex subunit delta